MTIIDTIASAGVYGYIAATAVCAFIIPSLLLLTAGLVSAFTVLIENKMWYWLGGISFSIIVLPVICWCCTSTCCFGLFKIANKVNTDKRYVEV